SLDESIKVMTFNIGYAGLGAAEDFVMDGGTKGRPDSKEVVMNYLSGIQQIISENEVDIYMFQEVDLNSRRSYKIDQAETILETLGSEYSEQFAYNFKALFVPFPVSLTDYIGYVESGIATYTSFRVSDSQRQQFPGSFSWPLRIANLKRAMMVSTLPIEGSDKSLIIVNLHMSAYDGDGSLRTQEMAFLKAFMEEQSALGNYVIIGGDFNQTFPEADGVYVVPEEYYVAYPIEENWIPAGYQFQVDIEFPSCRLLNQPYDPTDSKTQYYIIDGFIVSSNIFVEVQAQTLDYDFAYSDHNPVVLTIKLIP
ncbi:MAG: endonuclease/exonuclease/phosphatase family protein, partial [Acholeplasmataceae bacterium]|nr:endonuclease/exonuclease/phosphatase family protein [Acholeplasmataceae bacterium]